MSCLAVNQFPAEEVRRALGDKIQLTENQVQVCCLLHTDGLLATLCLKQACFAQVWFSHKRRKDKKTQAAGTQPQSTSSPLTTGAPTPAPAASAATPALPSVSAPQPPVPETASTTANTASIAPSASVVTHKPPASLPSFSALGNRPASSQADAVPSAAPQVQLPQPSPAAAPAPASAPMSVSVPLDRVRPQALSAFQPPHSYTNGYAPTTIPPPSASLANVQQTATVQAVPSLSHAQTGPLMPGHAQEHHAPHMQAAMQEPFTLRAEPAASSQLGQPFSQPTPAHNTHFQQQSMPHLQAALASTFPPRQSPAAAATSQQLYASAAYPRPLPSLASALHTATGAQGAPAADSSPASHRLTMPLSAGTFTVGASPAWLHQQQQQQQRNALRMPHASVMTPSLQATPAARSQISSMHSDMDPDTDDNDVASEGLRPDLRHLIELAKQRLPVPYRPDGPQLALAFDNPPSPDNDTADPDGPAKRKRVLVDGYEMEEDGEDGMNVRHKSIGH